MDHCTFGDATVSKLTSMHQITSKNYSGMWKSLLHSSNLVIFNFLVNSYRHLLRLYFVGTAGLRQPQSNWAIRLFTNNSPPKYSCHCSIFINCTMPLMRGNSSLRYKASVRVLQWVPIPMGTQYPPIPMGKWVGNGWVRGTRALQRLS
jgi:hypothetical protein